MKPCLALLIKSSLIISSLSLSSAAKQFTIVNQDGRKLEGAVLEIVLKTSTNNKQLDPAASKESRSVPYIIDQVNKQFVPELIVVPAGAEVSFPNSDNIRHHVYSFSKVKPFELKLYSGQPKDPIQFPNHGVVVLGCNIHDSMVGHIYIAQSKYVAASNDKGLLNIDLPEGEIKLISLWHSNYVGGAEKTLPLTKAQLTNNNTLILSTQPDKPRNTFQEMFKDNN
ncbi:MAG: methylamine utilization protein [Gammaproteobacteria bacterium]|nr:methylamine utilization protein [Gammaproteobacteria bacterium]